jgi:hypothetical protein
MGAAMRLQHHALDSMAVHHFRQQHTRRTASDDGHLSPHRSPVPPAQLRPLVG